jgi:glycosyltransferase involved in cell wall biosynthesis
VRVPARFSLLELGVAWPPETFLARKLRGLVAAGVEVSLATARIREQPNCVPVPGVRVVRLRGASGLAKLVALAAASFDFLVLALSDPRLASRLLHTTRPRGWLRVVFPIARRRPDVLHFEWEHTAVHLGAVSDALEIPFVVSCRGGMGVDVHSRLGLESVSRYREVFAKAAAVHCVAEALRDEVLRYGVDPQKARVIRSGVDSTFFSPGRRERAEFLRVISVGMLSWVKNFEDGITAISLLAESGVPARYEIVGAAPPSQDPGRTNDVPRLLYLIDELGLRDRVELVGQIGPEAVRDRMRASDVLLLTSLSEGIANCVLEAMGCGLPVVVTDCGGMREAVTDGVEGFVCPTRSPERLAGALRGLWEDADLARRLGEAGRRRVTTEFTLERETEAYLDLYEEVIAGSR